MPAVDGIESLPDVGDWTWEKRAETRERELRNEGPGSLRSGITWKAEMT
jgi:hypothetical protein